jgi:hypothetical protein
VADFDWTTYVVGGATRPDSISGMNPAFSGALGALFAAAPSEIQAQLRVSSGYRSEQRQAELWRDAVAKYGSEAAARKWVAPPGRSQHNHGNAADLRYLSPAAQEWVRANAGAYGLAFPMSHEPWHIELSGARDGHAQAGLPPAQDTEAPSPNALERFQPQPTTLDARAFQRQPVNAMSLVPFSAERRNILARYT